MNTDSQKRALSAAHRIDAQQLVASLQTDLVRYGGEVSAAHIELIGSGQLRPDSLVAENRPVGGKDLVIQRCAELRFALGDESRREGAEVVVRHAHVQQSLPGLDNFGRASIATAMKRLLDVCLHFAHQLTFHQTAQERR